MIKQKDRKKAVAKRHQRLRNKLAGCADRPRLAVHRTNKHIYAQLIDDDKGVTLAAASTTEKEFRANNTHGGDIESAKVVGKLIAERGKQAGVEAVVFDRGGFVYHGRIAALADAAREGGLFF